MNPNRKPDDGEDILEPEEGAFGDESENVIHARQNQDEFDDPSGEMQSERDEIRNNPQRGREHVETP